MLYKLVLTVKSVDETQVQIGFDYRYLKMKAV